MEIKLELVTFENLDLAYNIQKEIFFDSPDYLFLKNAIESNNEAYNHYLVYDKNKIIGITGTYVEDKDRDSIWLSWFGVLPNERSIGYGRKILIETEKICKKLSYKFFRCYTSSKYNSSALPLYNSFYSLSEKYENKEDETYEDTAIIYSKALINTSVPYWNNKYIGIKDYEQLCTDGEKLIKKKK